MGAAASSTLMGPLLWIFHLLQLRRHRRKAREMALALIGESWDRRAVPVQRRNRFLWEPITLALHACL